jgi:hypothetical protein
VLSAIGCDAAVVDRQHQSPARRLDELGSGASDVVARQVQEVEVLEI